MRDANLCTFSTDAAGKLNVLGHDSHTLGVDSTQVGIFEKSNKVSLGGLLQGKDSSALEAEVGLEILGNLTDQTLEGSLADEQISALLVLSDLTKSDSTGAVSVRLLDSSGGGGRLTCRLWSKERTW